MVNPQAQAQAQLKSQLVERRPAPVAESLLSLENHLSLLQERINTLQDKLMPVLVADNPSNPTKPQPESKSNVAIVMRLETFDYLSQLITEQVEDIINRCAL